MQIDYYPDTDTLYIALKDGATSCESEEVSDGIVLDYDEAGTVIGIEIDPASPRVNLRSLLISTAGDAFSSLTRASKAVAPTK